MSNAVDTELVLAEIRQYLAGDSIEDSAGISDLLRRLRASAAIQQQPHEDTKCRKTSLAEKQLDSDIF